jgi:protein-S-isoprenylcysteine O-methyltransferase Ste14
LRIRRRNLRKGLVAVGCLVGAIDGFTDPGAAGMGPGMGAVRTALALLLLTVGSALHLASKGHLEQNRRLVTAGPYRFTRNPFYLANLLIDLGLCCVIGRAWIAIPYLGLWWIAYHETIAREEARLAALFPDELARYAAAVPRLVPTGRRLPRAEAAGRFSFDNPALARGSEYARVLGVWLAAAAIVAARWLGREGPAAFAVENASGLGVVVLVAIAWALKLALAEAFRRPETALLPFDTEPARRRAVALGLLLALYAGGRMLEDGSRPASPALLVAFAAIVVLPFASTSALARCGVHAALVAAIAVFAAEHALLPFAGAPLLWVALMALDDFARERMSGARPRGARGAAVDRDERADPAPARAPWSMARPLAMFMLGGTALLVGLRMLV